ncbi:MAG TPA: protein translocase subunit SecD [Solirubrobacterales bacterium]|nr:protein translocase subunit SecD [Solirubrobacterales bacterium]
MTGRRRNLFVLLFVVGLTVASIVVILSQPTKLGLDLRGGTSLVYQGQPTPQQPEVDAEAIDRAIEIIRQRVDTLGVAEPEINRVGTDQIDVGLPDIQDIDRAVEVIGTTAQMHFYDWEPNVIPQDPNDPNATEQGFNREFDAVKFASKQKPECFRNLCTTNGPTYYLFDRDSLELLTEPSQEKSDLFLDFPRERQPKNSVVVAVPQGTRVVEEPPQDDPATEQDESTGPPEYFVIRDRPELSGTDITSPEQNSDPTTNQPNVTFDFTDEGRESFERITSRIAQRAAGEAPPGVTTAAQAEPLSDSFAIVLDDVVQSRPIINFVENPNGIDGRTGAQISGSFTISEAQDLAETLRIGALPIELKLISQSTVSATLGQEALDQGLTAGIVGLVIVTLFLLAYYRFLGFVAALGLAVYALFFFALIKLIPITLTLPGIAGLILTIGVAADSNIVIFERIKEEVRAGRSMASAISAGYRKGIATIIDANVITLIAAFILFVLATAGVKGFAFTLGVGTIVSLFTAVVFTQAVLGTLGRTAFVRSPRFLGAGTSEQRVRWHFDFTGMSKWFFSVSGAIIAIGAIAFATLQFNLGIDFESGTRIKAALAQDASVEDVRTTLSDAGISGAGSASIQDVDDPTFGDNVVQVEGEIAPAEVGKAQAALEQQYGIERDDDGFQNQSIGPSFGEQVATNAVRALILSLLVIAIYVAIRFQPKYAVPVLIALVHDVLITAGVYSLSEREVTSATVAAFLTILGYSMYDTVIVFDRIRENEPRLPRATFSQIVNRSMSEVFTRSIITGLSTVFLLAVLLIFGGETLQDFAFAMMVGVASGFYSSIFIASPVLTAWKEREPQYRARRAHLEETMGYVPAFPEENVVARVDEPGAPERPEPEPEPEPAAPAAAQPQPPPTPAPAAPAAPSGDGEDGAPGDGAPERPAEPLVGAEAGGDDAERRRAAKRNKRRQRQRRRKHGRHR